MLLYATVAILTLVVVVLLWRTMRGDGRIELPPPEPRPSEPFPILDTRPPFEPPAAIPPSEEELALHRDVIDLLRRADKIGAIKLYRERTGASLVDAKNRIESWAVPSSHALAEHVPEGISADVAPPPLAEGERAALLARCLAIARDGDKIGAIKRWREGTGCGLAEAKSVIEHALAR